MKIDEQAWDKWVFVKPTSISMDPSYHHMRNPNTHSTTERSSTDPHTELVRFESSDGNPRIEIRSARCSFSALAWSQTRNRNWSKWSWKGEGLIPRPSYLLSIIRYPEGHGSQALSKQRRRCRLLIDLGMLESHSNFKEGPIPTRS